MKKPTASFRLVVVLIAAAVLAAGGGPAVAHPEGPAHHNPLPAHATEVMRAFAADQQAPSSSGALGANPCSEGFAGPYPCSNVDLLAYLPLSDIGGTRSNSAANDIWGWTDPATGKEYAIVGRVFGTSFVDISDPTRPVYLGQLPTHGPFGSSWRDIKVYANHAFIVSEATNHGMQVFDLTQLRNVSQPPVTFSETAHYKKMSSAHNIAINEASGFAYIVGASGRTGCSGGLHMVDIRKPTSPSFAGCFSADGYTHDTQCVLYDGPDADHRNREICFNSNEDTVTIVDVTDKSRPVQLSRTGYAGSAYTHQGWLTEDRRYFLLDDELDEQNFAHNTRTRVWDVSDLDKPIV
ncbi:MAG: choice-of-anchor B family protein, partial [Actinomycetota bacterium]|nr:choice-of-anchor B family protein [Actinomycetota bacterium]